MRLALAFIALIALFVTALASPRDALAQEWPNGPAEDPRLAPPNDPGPLSPKAAPASARLPPCGARPSSACASWLARASSSR